MPTGVYIKTEEHKRKVSRILKKKYKEGLITNGFQKGHKSFLTEESKRKLSESSKGNTYRLGIKHSAEAKQKISVGLKGRQLSEATKKKISLAHQEEKHYRWMGDKVGYGALHVWVRKHLGTPDTCEFCEKSGLTGHKINWANKSGNYLRDLNDWIRLCAKCHQLYDKNY